MTPYILGASLVAAGFVAGMHVGAPPPVEGVDSVAPPLEYASRPTDAREWVRWRLDVPDTYEVTGDMVVARATGLTWRRACSGPVSQAEAEGACASVKDGGGAWRLPTRAELQSLVDYGVQEPAIDGATFPGTPAESFWSASRTVWNGDRLWTVSFRDGRVDSMSGSGTAYVRCVR